MLITTDKQIKKGRQVYLNYETYPSHHYLLRYGFVATSNIHDCLLVPLPNATSLSPLLRRVLEALGYPSDDTMCLDITRFLNDKALAFFLLRDANPVHLQQCLTHYENVIVKEQEGRWEAHDVRRCALGTWTDNSKTLWDGVKDELKKELHDYLKTLERAYSTSIAYDNVSEEM